jgi:two-component system NtrC family sensor kinase
LTVPRVLIIEDSPTQAAQLALILEDAGFDAETAPDAERGFARLASEEFDLVLSDLHLPGDSGFEFCRRVKADLAQRRIPIVVCTSEADPVNVLRGLQAGADGFFTKQRDPQEVVNCLRSVLNRPREEFTERKTQVTFLDHRFEISAGRTQLLDVLLSAFEDVVHLNKQYQASTLALRELNRQLEERNLQLKQLADSEHQAHEERKRAESQLVQAEKLSALGKMVAGVAHEINNPLAFVLNNIAVLRRDLGLIQELLTGYQEVESAEPDRREAILERLRLRADEIDLPYTLESLALLIGRSEEGLRRIQQIVRNLRDFARLDEGDLKEVDLNDGIVSTLNILGSRARERQVAVETDLGHLPAVVCYPAKINQVVLNLVANAIDACEPGGRVTVQTRRDGPGVAIRVEDTGCGIDPSIRDKIFDPFFTTKSQGQGTGLGLSISYGIVQAHGGRIDLESPDRGTRFVVRLPLEAPPPGASPSR